MLCFKVQLRLQQVVGAPVDKREDLLKELEQFAFRGIPNLASKPKTIQEQEDVPLLNKMVEETELEVRLNFT